MRGIPSKKISNNTDLDIFEIYSVDVNQFASLDRNKNNELMLEIFELVSKMNEIFNELGCDDKIFDNKRVAWLSDKFDYCLDKGIEKDTLIELKRLYDKYLEKSHIVIEGNLKLVFDIAAKYKGNQIISHEDVVQCGNIGLIRACEKYNPNCGASFANYAIQWIKQVITKEIRGVKSAYRIPNHYVYENSLRLDVYQLLVSELGREPTNLEVAKRMGRNLSDVENMINVFTEPLSLNESSNMRYGDIEVTLGDTVTDPDADIFAKVSHEDIINNLRKMLPEYLTPREYEVIENSIGLNGQKYNHEEIADLLGVSRQRVDQLKQNAVKRLVKNPSFMDMLLD